MTTATDGGNVLDAAELRRVLREMDAATTLADENGDAEVAWYYYRDAVEDAMGLERGALDTGPVPDDEEE